MDEARKLEKLFGAYSDSGTDESLVSFLDDFDTFLQEMRIPQSKKQLIMNYEDVKPYMLNINS